MLFCKSGCYFLCQLLATTLLVLIWCNITQINSYCWLYTEINVYHKHGLVICNITREMIQVWKQQSSKLLVNLDFFKFCMLQLKIFCGWLVLVLSLWEYDLWESDKILGSCQSKSPAVTKAIIYSVPNEWFPKDIVFGWWTVSMEG